MSNRVRFAPAPTGEVHIGNIRTAIFNWLYARHTGGRFLLRIEDTDRERSTPAAIASLLDVMAWLGLAFDEEPLYQSARLAAHTAAADQLLADGHAYRHAKGEGGEATLFRIPWDSDAIPEVREAGDVRLELHAETPVVIDFTGVSYALLTKKGKASPQAGALGGFHGLQLLDASGTILYELDPDIKAVLDGESRQFEGVAAMTFRRCEIVYTDLVKGELRKPLDSLKDQVIVRSDGAPVFHLANVCDDIEQGITEILRGDDHVENTYRHILLFRALGATPPAYGHFPMIVNAQGKPFSKRDGDAYVGDFRAKGYLPEALLNYLTLLGWSPGDDREQMTSDELVAAFTLERVNSAAAQMDINKLKNLNGLYIAAIALDDFIEVIQPFVASQPWAAAADSTALRTVAELMQSRCKLFTDVADWSYYFTDDLEFDEKVVRKALQKDGVAAALQKLADGLAEKEPFDEAGIEAAIHAATEALGLGQGKLNAAIRAAVTGTNVGAGLYETMAVLGRERTCCRLQFAIDNLCAGSSAQG